MHTSAVARPDSQCLRRSEPSVFDGQIAGRHSVRLAETDGKGQFLAVRVERVPEDIFSAEEINRLFGEGAGGAS
jgi:hypothetical protein